MKIIHGTDKTALIDDGEIIFWCPKSILVNGEPPAWFERKPVGKLQPNYPIHQHNCDDLIAFTGDILIKLVNDKWKSIKDRQWRFAVAKLIVLDYKDSRSWPNTGDNVASEWLASRQDLLVAA
jgi:hypothetical protein